MSILIILVLSFKILIKQSLPMSDPFYILITSQPLQLSSIFFTIHFKFLCTPLGSKQVTAIRIDYSYGYRLKILLQILSTVLDNFRQLYIDYLLIYINGLKIYWVNQFYWLSLLLDLLQKRYRHKLMFKCNNWFSLNGFRSGSAEWT